MTGYTTISALAAAATLTGTELLEVSQLSTTVTISAATISAQASDNSFNDSGNGFATAGFAAGDRVKVAGFTGDTANNIFVGVITVLTAGKMTIGGTDGDVIVDDAAGETVTITKWVSRRTSLTDIAGALTTGLLDLKGSTDCSANPNYPAASKGDTYIVSVAGKIGGVSGTTVNAGDWYIALADNAGGTEASVGSSWGHVEHNITVSDDAYDATSWNGNTDAPSKNAVRDKIEAIIAGAGTACSTTEQLTGADATKLSTPDSVAALWEQGSDVASAGTVSLGEGGYFVITGTTTITDIDFATDKAGRKAWVKFAGALTLTHNASTLILPTGANITTAAGDTACFISEGSDVIRCVAYQRADGRSVGAGIVGSQSGTSYTAVLTDANTYIRFSNASAISFTIPPNSSVAYPVGTVIEMEQAGAGALSVVAGSGVTINSRSSDLTLAGQYAVAFVKKVATDTWTMNGDL